jgi:hypothetical protein
MKIFPVFLLIMFFCSLKSNAQNLELGNLKSNILNSALAKSYRYELRRNLRIDDQLIIQGVGYRAVYYFDKKDICVALNIRFDSVSYFNNFNKTLIVKYSLKAVNDSVWNGGMNNTPFSVFKTTTNYSCYPVYHACLTKVA